MMEKMLEPDYSTIVTDRGYSAWTVKKMRRWKSVKWNPSGNKSEISEIGILDFFEYLFDLWKRYRKWGINRNDHIYDKGQSAETDVTVRVSFIIRKLAATDL